MGREGLSNRVQLGESRTQEPAEPVCISSVNALIQVQTCSDRTIPRVDRD